MLRRNVVGESRGVALVAAIWLVVLLSAVGLGLVLTSGVEAPVARNFAAAWAAATSADAAAVLCAHDLAFVDDWSEALRGSWAPPLLTRVAAASEVPFAAKTVGQLTALAECGRTTPCTQADRVQVTIDRPWGSNNPTWAFAGLLTTGPGLLIDTDVPLVVAVWAGDDPSEADGDPLADGTPSPSDPGQPGPGRGRILLRAEAFGPAGAHASVVVAVARPAAGQPVRLSPGGP